MRRNTIFIRIYRNRLSFFFLNYKSFKSLNTIFNSFFFLLKIHFFSSFSLREIILGLLYENNIVSARNIYVCKYFNIYARHPQKTNRPKWSLVAFRENDTRDQLPRDCYRFQCSVCRVKKFFQEWRTRKKSKLCEEWKNALIKIKTLFVKHTHVIH